MPSAFVSTCGRIVVLIVLSLPLVVSERAVALAEPSDTQSTRVVDSLASRVGLPADSVEVTENRTEMSTTFANTDGTFTSLRTLRPLNYQDDRGVWQAIDTTLVDVPGGFVSRSNRFRVQLPDTLREPVRLSQGDSWVSFALTGAVGDARASVAGSTATYEDILPGVSVRYTSMPDGLKEDIVLAGLGAARSFVFEVEASQDLRVVESSAGDIAFLDGAGKTQFAIVPPFMSDSSGSPTGYSRAVSLSLERVAGLHLVTLTADPSWLAAPERVWPVRIDPTVVVGGTDWLGRPIYLDCYLQSGSYSDVPDCGGDTLWVGHGSDLSEQFRTRAVLKSDVSDVPQDAVIYEARLRLGIGSKVPYEPESIDISLHELIRAFDLDVS